MAKTKSGKAPTKSEVYATLADKTGLTKKQVSGLFDAFSTLIGSSLKKGGAFVVPGLLKLTAVRKPAVPARKGVNPFTGEPTTFKARPARTVVKARPMKALKEMV